MEKHLEEFLVHNWAQTELGKKYKIFEEDGEIIGQQYQTDTGPITNNIEFYRYKVSFSLVKS
jgi:restriction system protein